VARNEHEKLNIISDVLESMLEEVKSRMPKESFRNIDNTPKHLLHMTEEDLKPKSPSVLREELVELIKEAKSKIKPVLIAEEDRKKYIRPAEEFAETTNKDLINIDCAG